MAEKIPEDGVLVRNARLAVKAELKKKQILQQPIARFDVKTGSVYLEQSDGTRIPVGEAMKRGRYSDRLR
ncbi:MAG: hypothetical protein HFE99_02335 [Ruminiclostridium sp.]|jgi:hypothetical protein|nr:hypothetical protein [Ruminiclostridium sp.]